MGNQVEKVLRAKADCGEGYSDFDLIMIAAGTNWGDYITTEYINKINEFFLKDDGTVLPLDEVDRHSWAGAMRYVYEKLREAYPNAVICYCSPIQGEENVLNPGKVKLTHLRLSVMFILQELFRLLVI